MWLTYKVEKQQDELEIFEENTHVLLDSIHEYMTKDSVRVYELGVLRLTVAELEQYRKEYTETLDKLNIRNKDLEALLAVQSAIHGNYSTVIRDSIVVHDTIKVYHYSDNYTDVSGTITGDTIKGKVTIYDTLTVFKHIVPKKFLCMKYGIKDVRISVTNANPNVKINDVEFIEITQ